LVSDAPSPLTYDAPKPPDVLEEDKIIFDDQSSTSSPRMLRITPVDAVFARDLGSELSAQKVN